MRAHLHAAAALVVALCLAALSSPVAANYYFSAQLMCEQYGKYISLGGDCCNYDGITIGYRSGTKCSVKSASCPTTSNEAAWEAAWPLRKCRVYKVVCEGDGIPAIIVKPVGTTKWKVWKECTDRKKRTGDEGLGIVVTSPGDDFCACGVSEGRKLLKDAAAAPPAFDKLPDAEDPVDT